MKIDWSEASTTSKRERPTSASTCSNRRCGSCDERCSRRVPVSWLFRAAYIALFPSETFETTVHVTAGTFFGTRPITSLSKSSTISGRRCFQIAAGYGHALALGSGSRRPGHVHPRSEDRRGETNGGQLSHRRRQGDKCRSFRLPGPCVPAAGYDGPIRLRGRRTMLLLCLAPHESRIRGRAGRKQNQHDP